MAAIFQFFRRQTAGKDPPIAISMKHTFKHQHYIHSFVFLQDNNHIVSGSEDGKMRKWDCETGQLVGEPWEGMHVANALALSPDGKTIARGTSDGSVQQWGTNGQMKKDIWRGHSGLVWSLSWSPNGSHLASGSSYGTILVQNVESGAVEVGPIETNQGWVQSVAYSPFGDRIASGGDKCTISIWDSHTGELLVGPINDLGDWVECVVWSSDGSKLYSASDEFARVFDSTSGTLLHRFQHDRYVKSIALSPKHNLLACVGEGGIAQLWDTESHEPFPVPFANNQARGSLRHVSFSPDGWYLAYGGEDKKITLWTVEDIAEPLVPASSTILQGGTQQIALPKSQSSSALNVDETNLLAQSAVNDDQGHNSPYNQFFAPSHSPLPSPSSNTSPRHRSRHIFSMSHLPISNSMRHNRLTRRVFLRRTLPTSSHPPANSEQPQPGMQGISRAVNQDDEPDDIDSSENVVPGIAERGDDKGKQRGDPIPDRNTSTPRNLSSPDELHSDENRALWKSLFRKAPAKVTRDSSPKVVDIYAVRHHKGYVVHKRSHKKKSAPRMTGVQTIAAPEGGSSQAGQLAHGNPAHRPTSSQGQAGPSSQPISGHPGELSQVNEVSYSDSDSCSDSSTHGPLFRFFDKMCFPCGHYKDEDEDT